MPHCYNRRAFLKGTQIGDPLLETYCLLVVIELALKDYFFAQVSNPLWNKTHDIPTLLGDTNDPNLTSLAIQLKQELQITPCTTKNGTLGNVPHDKYPYLRYVRHDNDYQTGLTDADLSNLRQIVQDILSNIRRIGITV